MAVKVATGNLPARRMTSDDVLKAAVRKILAERPRYVGLQEVGPDRNDTLAAAGIGIGYRLVRAKGGPLVLYDAAAAEVLRVRRRVLSRRAWVGRLAGRKSTLPACVATEVVFEDDELGEVAVLDAHLDAEVQSAGGYRNDEAHRPRVRRHRRQCRRLARRAQHHLDRRRWVFVCVDGNFDDLQLPPLASCWDGREGTGTLEGPNGNLSSRAVDIVFAPGPATNVTRITTGSDHRAVVATYKES